MEPLTHHNTNNGGWIEVICGSMFSGKTEELIRRLKRARIAKQQVEIYKPAVDARFSETDVVSHDENAIPSIPVQHAAEILMHASDADVVGIDEGQFFNNALIEVCCQLARDGKRVIIAGLDQDYLGKPFEPIPNLMAVAEFVTKLHAVCMVCGSPANHSQRLNDDDDRLLLGASEAYEPRCRRHFNPQNEPDPAPAAKLAEKR